MVSFVKKRNVFYVLQSYKIKIIIVSFFVKIFDYYKLLIRNKQVKIIDSLLFNHKVHKGFPQNTQVFNY